MSKKRRMRIGLTGGIGAGKSTAAGYLRKQGYCVLDADEFAHTVVEAGKPALQELEKQFGSSIIKENGELNRKRMAEIIFSDPDSRRRVESVLHEKILEEMKNAESESDRDIIFWEVPLLFESGWSDYMDESWMVDAEEEQQIRRTVERDDAEEDDVRSRMKSQMSRDEKCQRADRILRNVRRKEDLYHQIDNLLRILQRKGHE